MTARMDRPRQLHRVALDVQPALERVGRLVGHVQLTLQRVGVGVAANRDVAREERLAAAQDVDVDGARAEVDQRHDHVRVEPVVDLVGVLQREGVDVDDDGRAAGLGDDAGVVGDLLLLRGDEEDVHRARGGAAALPDDLVIQVDVLDVEGDVLLRLPVDGLGELLLGHLGQRDLLDDDGVARERGGDVLRADVLRLEQAPDRVGDRRAVDDGAVDDAVRRHRLDAERGDLERFARAFELHGLDGARADVQSDDCA